MTNEFVMDQTTNLQELKKMVVEFRDERDWRRYDTPKNLAISISIEAAELLEHFQWRTDAEVDEMVKNPQGMNEISEELADVMIYCLGLSDAMKIDVTDALRKKLEKTMRSIPWTVMIEGKKRPKSLAFARAQFRRNDARVVGLLELDELHYKLARCQIEMLE